MFRCPCVPLPMPLLPCCQTHFTPISLFPGLQHQGAAGPRCQHDSGPQVALPDVPEMGQAPADAMQGLWPQDTILPQRGIREIQPSPRMPRGRAHPLPSPASPQCSGSPAVPLSLGGAAPVFHLQRTTELCCQCRCSLKRLHIVPAPFVSNPTAAREVINPIFNNPNAWWQPASTNYLGQLTCKNSSNWLLDGHLAMCSLSRSPGSVSPVIWEPCRNSTAPDILAGSEQLFDSSCSSCQSHQIPPFPQQLPEGLCTLTCSTRGVKRKHQDGDGNDQIVPSPGALQAQKSLLR